MLLKIVMKTANKNVKIISHFFHREREINNGEKGGSYEQ